MTGEKYQQSTFLSEAAPASPSASPDSERDWMTRVATWPSSTYAFSTTFGHAGAFSRTSLDFCRRTEDGRSEPFSGRWKNSGTGGPTGSWTRSTRECHNDAVVSSLSAILETGGVPRRFYLTPKACAGILRRADKRGKALPPQLKEALEAAAGGAATP